MFQPRLKILPKPQRALWPELVEIPRHFILYGGTALALRMGHRESLDFDYFSSEDLIPSELLGSLSLLKGAKILQNTTQTLVVDVDRNGPVKMSFFGGLTIGRVGEPEMTPDGVLRVASLLDIAGTKAAVVTQRAESKDYIDLLAIIDAGISLSHAMAAARALYGEPYNPLLTVKALSYFGDGDLHKLTSQQKNALLRIASTLPYDLPNVLRLSNKLSP